MRFSVDFPVVSQESGCLSGHNSFGQDKATKIRKWCSSNLTFRLILSFVIFVVDDCGRTTSITIFFFYFRRK